MWLSLSPGEFGCGPGFANTVNLTLPCPLSPLIVSVLQTLTYKGWEQGAPAQLRHGFNNSSPLQVAVNLSLLTISQLA